MAVTAKLYGNFLLKALNKEVDFDTDVIKLALYTALTIDQDGDIYKADLTATEVANGNGYTTGGATLANKSITYDSGTNVIKLDADDVTWAAATITARYAVMYVATGVDGTSVLIGYIDFGQDMSSSNGDFKITWDAAGIATITVS